MKTAILLPTAFVTTSSDRPDRDTRISQYINGFNKISEFISKHPELNLDVYVVDSTVENEDSIDPLLNQSINSIKNLKGKFYFINNEYGKINKGAGLIVQWKYALSKIGDQYDYVIHFEPRQRLTDFSFFERFVANPQNYARSWFPKAKKFKVIPITLSQILTGMIALNRNDLEKYCNSVDLDKMVRNRISIEDDIYKFLTENNIKFEHVDKLGISWHDVANDIYVDL
ncbi:hypothetical protein M0P65_06610 [Candidatus Gracilibacteria bacterium]|nr:hypothetical protein [Candidatus Gracilibacteria bacterium]